MSSLAPPGRGRLPEGKQYYRGVPLSRPPPRTMPPSPSGAASPHRPPPPATLPRTDAIPAGPPPTVHHSRQLVALNVGGRRFVTLYETLARFRSPYFERLITVNQTSGKIIQYDANIIMDPSGAMFINRDGDLFAHVLNYMRDGKNVVLPEKASLLRQLRREADFFGLSGFREVVEETLRDVEQSKDERDETLQTIKATVNSISQSLYVTNFARRG